MVDKNYDKSGLLNRLFSQDIFWKNNVPMSDYVDSLSEEQKAYVYKKINNFFNMLEKNGIDFTGTPEWLDDDVHHIAVRCMSVQHARDLFS